MDVTALLTSGASTGGQLAFFNINREIERMQRVVCEAAEYRLGAAKDGYVLGFAALDLLTNEVNHLHRARREQRGLIGSSFHLNQTSLLGFQGSVLPGRKKGRVTGKRPVKRHLIGTTPIHRG